MRVKLIAIDIDGTLLDSPMIKRPK